MEEQGSYDSTKSYDLLKSRNNHIDVIQRGCYGCNANTRSFLNQSLNTLTCIYVSLFILFTSTTVLFVIIINLQLEVNNLKEISKACLCKVKHTDVVDKTFTSDKIYKAEESGLVFSNDVSDLDHSGYRHERRSYNNETSNQYASSDHHVSKNNLGDVLMKHANEVVHTLQKDNHIRTKRADGSRQKNRKGKKRKNRKEKKTCPKIKKHAVAAIQLYGSHDGLAERSSDKNLVLSWKEDQNLVLWTKEYNNSGYIHSQDYVEVRYKGAYFIYMQITSTSSTIFSVYVNKSRQFSCVKNDPPSSISQCYSAMVVILDPKDKVTIKDDSSNSSIPFHVYMKPHMTFWGIYKL